LSKAVGPGHPDRSLRLKIQYTPGLACGSARVYLAIPQVAAIYSHFFRNPVFGNNCGGEAVLDASAGMTGLCSNTYPQETIDGFPNRAAADR
jgi:hypothetical protein